MTRASPNTDVGHRYIEKFYSMRTQLQAISLRIQVSRVDVGDTSVDTS